MEDNSEWRVVGGFPDFEVSSKGEIRTFKLKGSTKRVIPKVRKLHKNREGYFVVTLKEKNLIRTFRVNRLVAGAFLPITNGEAHVAHLDGDRTNNNVSNLKWCTPKENNSHKILHGTSLHGERNHWAKLTTAQIDRIRELKKHNTDYDLARIFNVNQSTINRIVNKKRRSLG